MAQTASFAGGGPDRAMDAPDRLAPRRVRASRTAMNPHPEQAYLDLLARCWRDGAPRTDRTGVGTRARFGETLRFDLSDGRIPLLTTKRVYWKTALRELLWFLSGDTSIRPLLAQGVRIWTDWPLARFRRETGEAIAPDAFEARILADDAFAARWGDLGPVYGKQWRRWAGPDGREHDQVAALIDGLRRDPASRRLLFTGWNVAELADMALPPCHMTYQYFVADGRLSGLLFQRSCDVALGLPFNLFEAAALIHLLAAHVGLKPGTLSWFGGDVHVYATHGPLVETQTGRAPRPWPRLRLLRTHASIDDYRFEDFAVEGYEPWPAIPAPIAV
jgi:thymidylate synthase